MTIRVNPATKEQFRAFVADRFGLKFDDAKLGFLGDLLRRRAAARGTTAESYLMQVDLDAVEAGLLAQELTVGETYFFRNGDQFRAFRDLVLTERMKARASSGKLAFLSAGCSTGEEPYTIAMLTSATVPASRWQVSIRAVDINPVALQKAKSGCFGDWALRETPAEMRQRWFASHGREMMLSRDITEAVRFDQRNLVDEQSDVWVPEAYDAIFCRNVIMYLTPAVQHAVIARIARSLAPGGYLFLGHAETLRGLSHEFHLVHTHDTFYYQRRLAGEGAPTRQYIDLGAYLPRSMPSAPHADDGSSWYDVIGDASRRIEALVRPAELPVMAAQPQPWNLETVLDLLQRERFAEALDLIGLMPAEAAQDPDVLLLHALLLVQDGKLAAAGDVCRILLAQDELNAAANHVLALCYEGSGDGEAALRYYDIAIHLDANFAMPRLRRGVLARRSGKRADAKRDLEHALELLKREDTSRLLLFGGGFTRGALARLCESELRACEAAA